jgi:arabinofuranosyltransferase
MAGRHWAAPFFLVVLTVAGAARDARWADSFEYWAIGACVLLVLRFGIQPMLTERDVVQRREQGRFAIVRAGEIRDQRFNCQFYEGLFGSRGPVSEHAWSQNGIKHRERAAAAAQNRPGERFVVVDSAAGKTPYHAGPDVIYIDALGIVDPLLARLPDEDGRLRIVGHLKRHVPAGYVEARRGGSLEKMHPDLRAYYQELRFIVSGPLFDMERMRKILYMNIGRYDARLAGYARDGYRKEIEKARSARQRRK